MRTERFKRAAATSPGKHGDLDWRVTLSGTAPEHAELVFIVGMMLLAEDRYSAPWQLGRYKLWDYLDALLLAKTPERIIQIAEDCQASIDDSPAKRQRLSA